MLSHIAVAQNGNFPELKYYDWIMLHGINSSSEIWNGSLVETTIENEFKNNTALKLDYSNLDENHINSIAADIRPTFDNRPGHETIVLAHSMGGLVTRSYLQQFGAGKLSTLITIGTPHLGANIVTEQGMGKSEELVTRFLVHAVSDIYIIAQNSLNIDLS